MREQLEDSFLQAPGLILILWNAEIFELLWGDCWVVRDKAGQLCVPFAWKLHVSEYVSAPTNSELSLN